MMNYETYTMDPRKVALLVTNRFTDIAGFSSKYNATKVARTFRS